MYRPTFGELLRGLRESRSISLRSLASSADMDPAYLSRIENGKTGAPKEETVERLGQAMCREQQLSDADCERLNRQLMVAAGHLPNREELIDDLEDRFATRLRASGLPEAEIDEVLEQVSLPAMRRVLLSDDTLEIGSTAPDSTSDFMAAEGVSDELDALDVRGAEPERPVPELLESEPMRSTRTSDSATRYLARHADDFTSYSHRRTSSAPGPDRSIRAGRNAVIHVRQQTSKQQTKQLRQIAKLIELILKENN